LFFIQKGKLKLTAVSNSGKEAVVAILGAGDFFGEGCLAGQPVRMSTAAAMSDCAILRLEKVDAIRVALAKPQRFRKGETVGKVDLRDAQIAIDANWKTAPQTVHMKP
jgi:CRP-like cAMP-binding protein